MRDLLYIILAIVIVAILWRLIAGVIFALWHLALIALFVYLIYLVFKALTGRNRESI